MHSERISRPVAAALIVIAILLALWQFVFRRGNSMSFSSKDLPASMKTTTPPAQISGVIPRRSPHGSANEFTGGVVRTVPGEKKGPPDRQ
ncbi:MAG TPA: hypothetical protein VKT32_03285 [Chthonomonadaceae bacterium]|nr:hypothetical protein [Chthonomonadaceae bacterium]